MSKNHIERHLIKLAAEQYESFAERGGHFSVTEVGEKLAAVLHSQYASDRSIIRDWINFVALQLAKEVDSQRTKPVQQAQLLDDLERIIPVDEGKRVRRRDMTHIDWTRHLAHVGANVARVNASAAKENERFAALSPYLVRGLRTGDACEAWSAAHPGEVLP